ncbi:MFS transporter [soil metagenome]
MAAQPESISIGGRLRCAAGSQPRPVWMLMLAVIVIWIGRGMVIPFTIIYFTQIVGLKGSLVGGGIAAASVIGLLAVTITAGLIDRFGGKPVLMISICFMGIAYMLLAWAQSVAPYLAFTMIFYIASQSYWPAIDSLTSSIARPQNVIASFSMVRVGNAVGIGLGGLVGGVMVSGGGLSEYRAMFTIGGGLFLVGALLIWFLVPAPKEVHYEDDDPNESLGWSRVLRDRTFMYAMVLLFILVLGFTQMNMSVPPFLRGEAGAGEGFIGFLFFLNMLVVIALQVPIASRVDRGNAGLLLSVAAVSWAAAFGFMMLTVDALSAAYLVFAMFTLGELLFMPLSAVFAIRLAPRRLRGRYFSLLSMTWGGSAAIATLVAGWVQDADDPAIIWPIMAGIMVFAAIGALRLRSSERLRFGEPRSSVDSPLPAIAVASERPPEQQGRIIS